MLAPKLITALLAAVPAVANVKLWPGDTGRRLLGAALGGRDYNEGQFCEKIRFDPVAVEMGPGRAPLKDCRALYKVFEDLDHNAFVIDNVFEEHKHNWRFIASHGNCGFFVRPDTTVFIENSTNKFWFGKEDLLSALWAFTTGPLNNDDLIIYTGSAICRFTDTEKHEMTRKRLEFFIGGVDDDLTPSWAPERI